MHGNVSVTESDQPFFISLPLVLCISLASPVNDDKESETGLSQLSRFKKGAVRIMQKDTDPLAHLLSSWGGG